MARKVFISFLGTNNYLQTYYEVNGTKSAPVRFIQEALTDYLCKDWSENDKILIFYTKDSQIVNWEDNGQERAETEIEKIGLKSILSKKFFSNIVEGVLIEEGFSENEIWSIFNVVYQKLENEDEIYFDVTHAFRSIPMFSTVLFNFANLMKGTKLKAVHYGAFEKLGPAYKVKNIPLEERLAPIIDLTSIIELQGLTQIASGFVDYGKIGKIGSMLSIPEFSNNSLKQAVQRLKLEIENLETYIVTNRISKIVEGKFVDNITSQIKQLKKSNSLNHPEIEILDKLMGRIAKFSPKSEDNVQAAIEWAYEFDMLPQAYTLAQEYIISLVSQKYEAKFVSWGELKIRKFISAILGIKEENVLLNKFEDILADNIDLTVEFLSDSMIVEIRKFFIRLAGNRNILNHAKKCDKTIDKFKSEFTVDYNECINIILSC